MDIQMIFLLVFKVVALAMGIVSIVFAAIETFWAGDSWDIAMKGWGRAG